MKLDIYRMYIGKDISKERKLKIQYDKKGRKRPAWIKIEGLRKNVFQIAVRVNGKRIFYQIYLSPKIQLFLPENYTKEEIREFYNEFAKIYNDFVVKNNQPATAFLLKKMRLKKESKILDLGAGTGINAIVLKRKRYTNITLLDYAEEMLKKAKKKKLLKHCRFIYTDLREWKSKEQFDCIISVFSFALNSYFKEEEMPSLWKKIYASLKPKGMLALIGHDYNPPTNLFIKKKYGRYEIIPKYKMKWYIGEKR